MSDDRRQRELAKIHIGAKQLGIEDQAYSDMLWVVARVRSAADLDEYGRKTVLDHLRACGAVFSRGRRTRPSADKKKLIAKVRAYLAEAERPDAYADGMAKKMFGVDRFEWLDFGDLHKLVAALTYDAKRHGRRTQ